MANNLQKKKKCDLDLQNTNSRRAFQNFETGTYHIVCLTPLNVNNLRPAQQTKGKKPTQLTKRGRTWLFWTDDNLSACYCVTPWSKVMFNVNWIIFTPCLQTFHVVEALGGFTRKVPSIFNKYFLFSRLHRYWCWCSQENVFDFLTNCLFLVFTCFKTEIEFLHNFNIRFYRKAHMLRRLVQADRKRSSSQWNTSLDDNFLVKIVEYT